MFLVSVRLGASPAVAAGSAQVNARDLDASALRLLERFADRHPVAGARDPHALTFQAEPSLDSALELGEQIVAAVAQGNASLGNRPKPVSVAVAISDAAFVASDLSPARLTQAALSMRVRILVAAMHPVSTRTPFRALGHALVGQGAAPVAVHEALVAAPAIERRQKELVDARFRAALSAWRQGRALEAKAKFREVLTHAPLDGVALAYAEGAPYLAMSVAVS